MQANGLDERFNQTLQNMIVKFVEKKKELWEQFLDTCLYAYNTACHESTHYSPYELMFGRKPVLPIDIDMEQSDPDTILNEFQQHSSFSPSHINRAVAQHQQVLEAARANIGAAQQRQKEQYDRKHCKAGTKNTMPIFSVNSNFGDQKPSTLKHQWTDRYSQKHKMYKHIYIWTNMHTHRETYTHTYVPTFAFMSMQGTFEVGAKMLLKDFNRRKRKGGKLDHKWTGPYIITHHLGKGLYSLKAIDKPEVIVSRVNGVHLKPYHSPLVPPVKVGDQVLLCVSLFPLFCLPDHELLYSVMSVRSSSTYSGLLLPLQ